MNTPSLATKCIALLVTSCAFGAAGQLPTEIYINPTASYLLVNNDPGATDATPIDLAPLGIYPGDLVGLTAQGSFFFTHQSTNPVDGMSGVFSSSSTLLASNVLFRVPGAIASGTPYVSPNTYRGDVPTDIPQDFSIFSTNTTVRVPLGAAYLFVAAKDTLYKDNVDNSTDPFRLLIAQETETVLGVNISSADQSTHIFWNTDSNQLYQLQCSPSLLNDWTNVGTLVEGTGSVVETTNAPAGQPALFYRVERVP